MKTVGQLISDVNCILTATGKRYDFASDYKACLARAIPGLWDAVIIEGYWGGGSSINLEDEKGLDGLDFMHGDPCRVILLPERPDEPAE